MYPIQNIATTATNITPPDCIMDRNFTIFLKYEKYVKKLSICTSTVSELYDIAFDKFYEELGDNTIELYLEDKEFGVYCELEDIQQIYHGAIVGIRTKAKSTKFELNSSICSTHYTNCTTNNSEIDMDLININSLIEKDLNLVPNQTIPINESDEINNKENDDIDNIKVNTSPSYASIVASNLSSNTNISTPDSLSPSPNNPPNNPSITQKKLIQINGNHQDVYKNYTIPLNKYYILLTGVPYTATRRDIIAFFSPLKIFEPFSSGIFFVINYACKRIGHTFVVFSSKSDYELAFKKNGSYIGDRYIQILNGSLREFKKSVRISQGISQSEIINRHQTIIKLKGFSFDIDENAISEWLKSSSINILNMSIYIMYDCRNRNSGIAYLEFDKNKSNNNKNNQEEEIFKLNNEYLGCRYINVFRSTINELKLSLAQLCGTPLPSNLNPYLNCLRINGIASNCKHADIISFFSNTISVYPKQLHIKANLNVAYAEFKTQFECQLALTRNQTYMNNSLINLIQVSKYELRSVVGDAINNNQSNQNCNDISRSNCNFSAEFENYHNHTQTNKENINPHNHKFDKNKNKNKNNKKSNEKYLISIRGIPFESKASDIIHFFKGYNSIDAKSLRFIMDDKGRFCGQATIAFYDKNEARKAVHNLDRKYIGNRYVLLRLFS